MSTQAVAQLALAFDPTSTPVHERLSWKTSSVCSVGTALQVTAQTECSGFIPQTKHAQGDGEGHWLQPHAPPKGFSSQQHKHAEGLCAPELQCFPDHWDLV